VITLFKVRVGGGYLSIDEFIDTFTPLELERLDRNDPMKKFSERVAVQKTLAYQQSEQKVMLSPRSNGGGNAGSSSGKKKNFDTSMSSSMNK